MHTRFVLAGDDGDMRIGGNRIAQIAFLAINHHGDGGFGKATADSSGNLRTVGRILKLTDTAVGQRNIQHKHS